MRQPPSKNVHAIASSRGRSVSPRDAVAFLPLAQAFGSYRFKLAVEHVGGENLSCRMHDQRQAVYFAKVDILGLARTDSLEVAG